jgi:hypothetical protein
MAWASQAELAVGKKSKDNTEDGVHGGHGVSWGIRGWRELLASLAGGVAGSTVRAPRGRR